MRASALLCALLVAVLAVEAQADPSTSAVSPGGGSGREPVLRTGDCSLTAAVRASLDPRTSIRGEPGAEPVIHRDPPCDLYCEDCWLTEGEGAVPDDYVDAFNGGCYSSPEVFWSVDPSYGPVSICGQGGNYMYGGLNYRDTDWYELTFTESREITVTCTAEFPHDLYVFNGNFGCFDATIVASDSQAECVESSVTYTCTPGTWWIWVGASEFSGWPNDADYILTIYGYDYECDLECPGGALIEGEPECGLDYIDTYNGGCNSTPEVFQPLAPSASTIVQCGMSGYFDGYGTCYRDTDWYEIVLDEAREIDVCVSGEFPVSLMLLYGDPDCSNQAVVDYTTAEVCTEECITAVLDPGVYWVFVAPDFIANFPCSKRYVLTIDGYTTPVENRSWGLIKSLYR